MVVGRKQPTTIYALRIGDSHTYEGRCCFITILNDMTVTKNLKEVKFVYETDLFQHIDISINSGTSLRKSLNYNEIVYTINTTYGKVCLKAETAQMLFEYLKLLFKDKRLENILNPPEAGCKIVHIRNAEIS